MTISQPEHITGGGDAVVDERVVDWSVLAGDQLDNLMGGAASCRQRSDIRRVPRAVLYL